MKFGYNSTIGKKLKPCKSCGKDCYWFSKQRCADCARIEDTLKRMESDTEDIIKVEDLSGLIDDADTIFSQYIRLKDANEKGFARCFTCGIEKHWTILDAGHFISRSNLYLRWDERNVHNQCQPCNRFEYGDIATYSRKLNEICKGLPDILRAEAIIVHKPTRDEIRQIIAEYSPKVKLLKKQLKP